MVEMEFVLCSEEWGCALMVFRAQLSAQWVSLAVVAEATVRIPVCPSPFTAGECPGWGKPRLRAVGQVLRELVTRRISIVLVLGDGMSLTIKGITCSPKREIQG